MTMISSESVSVVLVAQNAQDWLAGDVMEIVHCLADLTSRFEIIVVDNASRDYTFEILDDLRCQYPQIRLRHLSQPLSMDQAAQQGAALATGDFLFTTTPGSRIEPNELRKLWALRVDPRLLVARSRTTARRVDASLLQRITQWAVRVAEVTDSAAVADPVGSLQMLRREAMAQLAPTAGAVPAKATAHHSPKATPAIEVSHVSHQQLASPKLVEARRRAHSETH